jgi:lysophospholipase L1-like esterase
MQTTFASYAAIGDSFTEGVGDELPDGRVRGWADLVALGLAAASPGPVRYANLAIRGRLLGPILAEQLEPAIALGPALISINGGGNDIIRPRVRIESIADRIESALQRVAASGAHVVFVSTGDMTRHIPLGSLVASRARQLATAMARWEPREGVTIVDNWADVELRDIRYWAPDRLHLNAAGHRRVAANVLGALEVPVPDAAGASDADGSRERTAAYWREYVLPWIGRRVTGRSSGDGRLPKSAQLEPVEVPGR